MPSSIHPLAWIISHINGHRRRVWMLPPSAPTQGLYQLPGLRNLPHHALLLELPEDEVSRCSPDEDEDFGAYRWALGHGAGGSISGSRPLPRPLSSYSFTMLVDSSVRGPFIPPMIKVGQ